MVQDEEQPKPKDTHDVSCQREQEQEEVAIVPPAYTVVHPRTVVIKVLQQEVEHGRKLLLVHNIRNTQTSAYGYGESPKMRMVFIQSSNKTSTSIPFQPFWQDGLITFN